MTEYSDEDVEKARVHLGPAASDDEVWIWAEHFARERTATQYLIVRLNYGRLHLLDPRIPEPKLGGDRSQIVCDPFTAGVFVIDTVDTMPDTPAGHGAAAARPDYKGWCRLCLRLAWDALVERMP